MSIEADDFIDTAFYKKAKNWENGVLYADNILLAAKDTVDKDYRIKDGTRMIAASAFEGINTLESVYLPDSIKAIGDRAFRQCINLSEVRMPEVGCIIGGDVFSETYFFNCDDHWENYQLYAGKHLISTKAGGNIKDGTLSIARQAIPKNVSISVLNIPASLTTISMPVACYDAKVNGVQVAADNKKFTVVDGILYDKSIKKLILCPTSVTEAVNLQPVKTIGEYAFYECKQLSNLVLPESLQTIEMNAFDTCVILPKLVIPDRVSYVAQDATRNCCDLQNIKFGKGMTYTAISTFASEYEGYLDIPYESQYINPSSLWGATTLLVASNSFALDFAKAYNIPYQINKEGPKIEESKPVVSKPVESKPVSKAEAKPVEEVLTTSESEIPSAESQPESVPAAPAADEVTTPTQVAVQTATEVPTSQNNLVVPIVVGAVALLVAAVGVIWWLQKRKSL